MKRLLKEYYFLFALVIVLGLPHLMAWLQPEKAETWRDWTTVVFFGVVGMATATALHDVLYPLPKLSYVQFLDQKRILVRFNNTATIVLTDGTNKIEIRITNDKYLWIRDQLEGSDLVIKETPISGRRVYLQAGEFFVSRQTAGYFVNWEDGPWKVVRNFLGSLEE